MVLSFGPLYTFRLPTRIADVVLGENRVEHLYYLLEIPVAWEEKPVYLTRMAYQRCLTISEAAGK